MRRILLVLAILSTALSTSVFAKPQPTPLPLQVTSGRIFMRRGFYDANSAMLRGENFSITSYMYYQGYNFNVCSVFSNPMFCRMGSSFSVPTFPIVALGDGVGDTTQFAGGYVILNHATFHTFFFGELNFSQATFYVPHLLRRRGFYTFTSPFTMTGYMFGCAQVAAPRSCVGGDPNFEAQVTGHGTVTVRTSLFSDSYISPYPAMRGESIEYRFEP